MADPRADTLILESCFVIIVQIIREKSLLRSAGGRLVSVIFPLIRYASCSWQMHRDPILLLATALEAPTVSIIVQLIELTMLHPGLLNRYWFLTRHYFPYIDPDHDFFAP